MYLAIEDKDTARTILNEILADGDADQKRKAQDLINGLS